jgi:membrane protease YdiL (CAAX protease family)
MIIVASPFLFLIPGVFEEYGWRGFMQKRLKSRTGVFVASIVVGLTWGMWHLMDFLMGNWLFEPFTVAVFFLYIVGVSLVSGFFYELSGGSVIVAMIVHFSANFVNSFFPIWRLETGVLSPLLYIGLIWLFCVIVFLAGFALSKTSGSGS